MEYLFDELSESLQSEMRGIDQILTAFADFPQGVDAWRVLYRVNKERVDQVSIEVAKDGNNYSVVHVFEPAHVEIISRVTYQINMLFMELNYELAQHAKLKGSL